MEWPRIGRILAFPRRNVSPRHRWEYIGRDRQDAYMMMDGSRSEDDLRRRGGRMAERFARVLGVRRDHRLLDVGCGVARVGRELAPRCGSYHGIDISRPLLARARERTAHLDNVDFTPLVGPGLAGLPDAAFDRVICHLVLLHVDESGVRDLLSGFARVLRPDGVAYFDLWNLRNSDAWQLYQDERLDGRLQRQPHQSRFYTRECVQRWTPPAGLDPVWLGDDTFLVQVVAMRADADPSARREVEQRLAAESGLLLPEGHLDFVPAGADSGST